MLALILTDIHGVQHFVAGPFILRSESINPPPPQPDFNWNAEMERIAASRAFPTLEAAIAAQVVSTSPRTYQIGEQEMVLVRGQHSTNTTVVRDAKPDLYGEITAEVNALKAIWQEREDRDSARAHVKVYGSSGEFIFDMQVRESVTDLHRAACNQGGH